MYYQEGAQANNDGTYHIPGQPESQMSYTLDGVSAKQALGKNLGDANTLITPPVETLQEAQVLTTGIPAGIEPAAGGAYSLTTKSGTTFQAISIFPTARHISEKSTRASTTNRNYSSGISGTSTGSSEAGITFFSTGGPSTIRHSATDCRNPSTSAISPRVTSTPSAPTLINEFRVGYQRRNDSIYPATANQGWAGVLGIPGVGPQTFPGLIASGSSSFTWTANPGGGSRTINEDVILADNVTKVHGAHTFKFGYQGIRQRENDIVGCR